MSWSHRRSSLLAHLLALGAAALLLRAALVAPSAGFVAGGGAVSALRGGRTQLHAESEAPQESQALVKVDEENTAAMASLIGGIAGAVVAGPILGLLGFAGAAFLVRQGDDNDAATALKGVAGAGLNTLNFFGSVDKKYEVTGKVGSALSEQVTKVKDQSPQAAQLIDGVSSAVDAVDKDIGIGSTLAGAVTGGSNLASQAVEKAVETNDKYRITDQIKEKIDDTVSQVQQGKKA